MNNNNIAAAEHVIGPRIVEKTKKNYRGKLNTIKVFLSASYLLNLYVVNNNIVLPLEDAIVKELFGWLSRNTDLPKKNRRNNVNNNRNDDEQSDLDSDIEEVAILNYNNNNNNNDDNNNAFAQRDITISHSTMQGYKRALLWLHSENSLLVDASINKWIDEFITAYKKSIAEKKATGIMSIQEALVKTGG